MKYKGLSLNYANIGLDMRIDMGLEVFVSETPSQYSYINSGGCRTIVASSGQAKGHVENHVELVVALTCWDSWPNWLKQRRWRGTVYHVWKRRRMPFIGPARSSYKYTR